MNVNQLLALLIEAHENGYGKCPIKFYNGDIARSANPFNRIGYAKLRDIIRPCDLRGHISRGGAPDAAIHLAITPDA